jgi:signal transduction histidine kinase
MACVFLFTDYVADSIFYGLATSLANLLRVVVILPAFFVFFIVSFAGIIKQKYELYVAMFYSLVSLVLIYVLYRLDNDGGNGISNTVGFLNLFFLLIFGFVLIGVRFYYAIVSSIVVSVFYTIMLFRNLNSLGELMYFIYQIVTIFCLCALLGYTRELILRADFATQFELAEARSVKERADTRYLDWLRSLAAFLRHEVRHPIAQIHSSLELIQLSHTKESISDYVANASNAAQHVWNLIERASRATDAEAFVRQSHARLIDLACLVREVVDRFRQTHSGVKFVVLVEGEVPIEADPGLVEEALGNILLNATSFAEDKSTIEVDVTLKGDIAFVAVRNRGPLISGDNLDVCFWPFHSSRAGLSGEHHGLGLYLVRLITEHYGGTASICNLSDASGVCVTMEFPVASHH